MHKTMRSVPAPNHPGHHTGAMAVHHGHHTNGHSAPHAGHAPAPPPKTVYGDGSWQLTIFVTDLQVEKSLRVRGDLHIGGVMIKLVDSLGMYLLSGEMIHSFERKYFVVNF